jgi:hypothetical protein
MVVRRPRQLSQMERILSATGKPAEAATAAALPGSCAILRAQQKAMPVIGFLGNASAGPFATRPP